MSRYQWIENGKEISIGWDIPLNTFFLQIHNPQAVRDRDYCELWLGTDFNEFESLEQLLEKARLKIDESLESHLLCDRYGISDPETLKPLPEHITKRF